MYQKCKLLIRKKIMLNLNVYLLRRKLHHNWITSHMYLRLHVYMLQCWRYAFFIRFFKIKWSHLQMVNQVLRMLHTMWSLVASVGPSTWQNPWGIKFPNTFFVLWKKSSSFSSLGLCMELEDVILQWRDWAREEKVRELKKGGITGETRKRHIEELSFYSMESLEEDWKGFFTALMKS